MRGFTIVELLIVVAVIIAIAALTIPVGVNFYRTQTLDDTVENIMTILRRAQAQAIFQKNDSTFGVKFFEGSYVLFQGSSYALRAQAEDETFPVPRGVSVSGFREVVFAKRTGLPNATGIIIVTSGSDTRSITINAQGKIEKN